MSQLEVPGLNGPLLLMSQQMVEQHISEALALQFQLTANSPFLTNPLQYELGLLGTSPTAQAILQGTSQCPDGVDLYIQQLISTLWLPHQSPQLTLALAMKTLLDIGSTARNAPPPFTLASIVDITRLV